MNDKNLMSITADENLDLRVRGSNANNYHSYFLLFSKMHLFSVFFILIFFLIHLQCSKLHFYLIQINSYYLISCKTLLLLHLSLQLSVPLNLVYPT